MIPKLDISKGRLVGVPFRLARVVRGPLKVKAIILHETAGPLTKGNCVKYFEGAEAASRGVSAHIVIDRDGTITQMVPFDKRANHAGQSSWGGKSFCNSFTIGIEIVGPGELSNEGRAWFQKSGGFPLADCKPTPKTFLKSHGQHLWLPYTPEQIASTKAVCRAIFEEYEDCNEIITHYLVSPGRKVDVNPLFPLDEVRRYAEGHGDAPDVAPANDDTAPVLVSQPQVVQPPANQPMTLTDLTSVSRHLGLIAKARSYLKWLVGGGLVSLIIDAYNYGMGVYNELSQVILDKIPLLVGITAGAVVIYLLSRALSGGQVAVQEGRYLPSGAMGTDSPLAGPSLDNLAGS